MCQFVVAGRGPAPKAPEVPSGPNLQENYGKAAPVSTYQDLLRNAHDEALYEHYFTGQLAFVNAATGVKTAVGKPGIFETASVSPDGRNLLVARQKRPFSRLVPLYSFAKEVEVWNRAGQLVRRIADLPVAENVPINGVPTGPRSYRWHPIDAATLVWTEALDGGDLRTKAPHRDKIVALRAPFSGEPTEVVRLEHRAAGMAWLDSGAALVSEFERATRRRRTWLLEGTAPPRKVWELSSEDRYGDPGIPRVAAARHQFGDPAGRRAHLPHRSRRLEGGRPPVPRPVQPEVAHLRAPLPLRGRESRERGRAAHA